MPTYTEQRFEDHIEAHLNQSRYRSLQSSQYNKSLCLIPNETLKFIQDTQLEVYQKLERQYGEDTPQKLMLSYQQSELRVVGCWTCCGKALRIADAPLI